MRKVGLIIIIVLAVFISCLFLASEFTLSAAKRQAIKKYADNRLELNKLPDGPLHNISPSTNYANVVWMNVDGNEFGFPAEQFTLDEDPVRAKVVLHHANYRVLFTHSIEAKEFRSVMDTLGETNFHQFVFDAYNSTEQDIMRQPTMNALQRHLLRLQIKTMFAAVGFQDSCLEFDRGDFKGFIIGNPTRNKYVYVRAFIKNDKIVDFGVIQEKPIQISDLENLISVVKMR